MTTRKRPTIDITIHNHGSIVRLVPNTDVARDWIDENIGRENGYQPYYPTVICEPRYVDNVIEGMQADGLTIR